MMCMTVKPFVLEFGGHCAKGYKQDDALPSYLTCRFSTTRSSLVARGLKVRHTKQVQTCFMSN